MPQVRATKQLDHRWTDLFALVLDLKDYPNFVPHCRAVKLIRQCTDTTGRTIIVSRMSVGVSALQLSYANRTTADPAARRIQVEALDGPLRRLAVTWRFEPLEEKRTRVDFAADYAFESPLLATLASELFNSMLREIMNAFERRAVQLLAPRRREARQLAPHDRAGLS